MKENNKIFWKFIKSKTKAKESIPCILDDDIVYFGNQGSHYFEIRGRSDFSFRY
jgi:hypothetical protein